jgi:hypothetical protein
MHSSLDPFQVWRFCHTIAGLYQMDVLNNLRFLDQTMKIGVHGNDEDNFHLNKPWYSQIFVIHQYHEDKNDAVV